MIELKTIDSKSFKKKCRIGHRSYGFVDLVEDIKTQKEYAMKIIKFNPSKKDSKESILSEIKSYLKVDCPAVLKIFGYEPPESTKNSFSLLLEYMPNGSLCNILTKNQNKLPHNFTKTKKYIILLGIALAMEHLHQHGIIHLDLKPDNILLDENFYPKICDFGVSYISDLSFIQAKMSKYVGTKFYMAPEIFSGETYSYKVDIYSFSFIAYELLTGKDPFKNRTLSDIHQGIRPNISKLDKNIQLLLNKCWSNDPMMRPPFSEIVNIIQLKYFLDHFEVDEVEVANYLRLFDKYSKIYDQNYMNKIKENIEKGDIDAMRFYGLIDQKEKLKYLKMAADKGNVEAMFDYANYLQIEESTKYLKMAADLGHVLAMHNYASHAFIGKGIPLNKQDAVKYYKMAADLGNPNAIFNYGTFLYNGDVIDMNKKEASKYIKKAADLGSIEAMNLYGRMLLLGDGIQADYNEGARYYKLAADLGNVEAMRDYGLLLLHGEKIPINKKEAARYLKMAAKQGDLDSTFDYAAMLFNGEGIPCDIKKAMKYFEIAANKHHPEAMHQCSILHFYNILTGNPIKEKKDDKKILNYIEKPSKFFNSDTLFDKGFKYLKEGNKEKAKYYLKQSAELENPSAKFYYKQLLAHGYGI